MIQPEHRTSQSSIGESKESEIDKSEVLSQLIIELHVTVSQLDYALRVLTGLLGETDEKNEAILRTCIGLLEDVRFSTNKLTESLLFYQDNNFFRKMIDAVAALNAAFNSTLENFSDDNEGDVLEGISIYQPRRIPDFDFESMRAGLKYIDHVQAGRDALHTLGTSLVTFKYQIEGRVTSRKIDQFSEEIDDILDEIHKQLAIIREGFEKGYPVVEISTNTLIDSFRGKLSKIPKRMVPFSDQSNEFNNLNSLVEIFYTTGVPETVVWAQGFVVTWLMNSVSNAFKAFRARKNSEGDTFKEELKLVLSMKCTEEDGKRYFWFALYDNGMGLSQPFKRFTYGVGGYDGNEASTTAGMASLLHSAQKFGGDMYLKNRKDERGAISVLKIQIK